MYYFRFPIPRNKDGTIARYSPGWFGTLAKCPRNVVVDMYNDKEAYGIAHTEDTFVPAEVTVIPTADALSQIAATTYVKGEVYVGAKLATRWTDEALKVTNGR